MNLTPQRPELPGRTFPRRVVLWLASVAVIMAAIVGLMFGSIGLLLKSENWVAHSYQVLDALDLTESFYSAAQSAERGYAATCKPAFLSPFRRDLPQIFGTIATLRRLTTDNPLQQARAAALGGAVSRELERMSVVITTATAGHQVEAEKMLTAPADVSADHGIAVLIDTMQTDERKLLAERINRITLFAWTTLISCAIGVLAIAAILFFVVRLIRRETTRREHTEASLKTSNEKLGVSLDELQRFNASARAVSLLGELLQSSQTIEEAGSVVAGHLEEAFPGSAISIALFNAGRDSVDMVQSRGDGVLFAPSFRGPDCWGLRRGRAHAFGPGSFEPPCNHVRDQDRYLVCIPMAAQGETLGVLSIATKEPLAEFARQTVQTVAERLALAMANLRLQDTLRHQSFRDPLTGLFNRRYMDEAMQREVTHAGRKTLPLTMAMLDIDHFKRFNDTYGHDGGDALLGAFGRLLAAHARSDDIVCRYGGEEFAILLPGADIGVAQARIEEIRLAVKKMQVIFNGRSLGPVTMSAGVALFPRDGATGPMVLAAADAALYAAKHGGRDQVVCADRAA